MKIAMLAGAHTVHAHRWVTALDQRGHEILLLSQSPPLSGAWGDRTRIVVLPYQGLSGYLRNVPAIKRAVATFRPDLLHAHYAGGYGLSALLTRFRPRILSVWGGDVFDVPARSPFHRWLIRTILFGQDRLTSTSHVMARQVRGLGVDRPLEVIPFGIDTRQFAPPPSPSRDEIIRIGTVKTMHPKYGIDILIRAFRLLLDNRRIKDKGISLRLKVVGGGPQLDELRALAAELNIGGLVDFVGQVSHAEVPAHLHRLDIFAAPSRLDSESFGVAIIEASACELPVVVSDAGGLPEVVDHGVTGFVVPRERPDLLAAKLASLVLDVRLRVQMGKAGRQRVKQDYEWSRCVDGMIRVYGEVLSLAGSDHRRR